MGRTLCEYISNKIYSQDSVASVNKSISFCFRSAPSLVRVFEACSGAGFCSGLKNVRVFDVRFLNFVRVFSVENLWRSLRESLLKTCGKVSTSWRDSGFCTWRGGKSRVFHGLVEKFSYGFSTQINRGIRAVLHSFHRTYYYYYYYIRKFWSDTAEICGEGKSANI